MVHSSLSGTHSRGKISMDQAKYSKIQWKALFTAAYGGAQSWAPLCQGLESLIVAH